MTPSDDAVLNPCPMCGGSAQIHRNEHNAQYVHCERVLTCGIRTAAYPDELFHEAIAAWNTRAAHHAALHATLPALRVLKNLCSGLRLELGAAKADEISELVLSAIEAMEHERNNVTNLRQQVEDLQLAAHRSNEQAEHPEFPPSDQTSAVIKILNGADGSRTNRSIAEQIIAALAAHQSHRRRYDPLR